MNRLLFLAVLLLGPITLLNSDRAYAQDGKTPLAADRLTFRVRVYNDEGVPQGDLSAALKIADTVLQRVDLQAIWQDCTVGNPNRDSLGCDMHPTQIDLVLYLVAQLEAHAPNVDNRALGYSLIPRNGERATMAYVCYARVRTVLSMFRAEELLGLAVAHEIGHLLLGKNKHSSSGLMRAPWRSKDLDAGDREQFTFTSEQVGRLRAAVLVRMTKGEQASTPSSAPAQTTYVSLTRTGSSIVVDVTVSGKTRHFLLDTGAGLSVLSLDTAGWSPVDLMKAVSSRSAVGLEGTIHSMGSATVTLELGRTIIVAPVAVADLNPLSKALNIELDGILGQDILSQFSRVNIDYKNKQLILEK